jgi:transposase InsO family protein
MDVTAVNQLWVADITYIRLATEFVYLAVVLDAFSRRVVGWALDRTLEAVLVMTALRRALQERRAAAGLVHHSDRGVQYACGDYTDLLKEHGIAISMSRKGNPYDTAALRIVHEDAEIRRGLPPGIPRHGGGARLHRRVYRSNLQPEAASLGARLPAAGGVRTGSNQCCLKQ